jgi:hypothetical protein
VAGPVRWRAWSPITSGWSPASSGVWRWRAAAGVAVLWAALGTAACSNAGARHARPVSRTARVRPESPRAPDAHPPVQTVASVPFTVALSGVRSECRATADAVGYTVPCPTRLPVGMTATSPQPGCRFAIIAPADSPACRAPQLRGWIFGTGDVDGPGAGDASSQHLVLWGAPRAVRSPARAIDGPTVVPGRVLPRGKVTIHGTVMRWYLVPMGNPSAFRGHLVLVWTAAGHTYAYGFHVTDTMAMARALDLELVRHLVLVAPLHPR